MLSMFLRRAAIALAVLALACAGCQAPPPAASPREPALPAGVAERGADAWRLYACRSCHGALAEGASAPALRGVALSAPDFLRVVRAGAGEMRGYSAAEIDDQRALDMRQWLRELPAAAPTPIPNDLGITTPPAMRVERFSAGWREPAGLAFGPDGALYVAEQGEGGAGRVMRLAAGQRETVAAGLAEPRGLAWWTPPGRAPVLLIAGADGLAAWQQGQASLAGRLGGGRANDVAVGADGLIYVTAGASGSSAPQPGSVWRFEPAALLADGGPAEGERFATGLRSASGIAFSPSGAIYVTDNGEGWPFQADAPDELNVLLGGGDYGWPRVWGQPPPDGGSIGPMALFPAGAGAGSLLFYSGRMFDEYTADLLVALPNLGQVARVEIVSDVTGYHAYVHNFIGGLQRPAALAEGPQGELYVADAATGFVYRLWR